MQIVAEEAQEEKNIRREPGNSKSVEMKEGRPKPPLLEGTEQFYLPELAEAEVAG